MAGMWGSSTFPQWNHRGWIWDEHFQGVTQIVMFGSCPEIKKKKKKTWDAAWKRDLPYVLWIYTDGLKNLPLFSFIAEQEHLHQGITQSTILLQ